MQIKLENRNLQDPFELWEPKMVNYNQAVEFKLLVGVCGEGES